MKKVLATLLAVFLLATMIPLGAVSVSAGVKDDLDTIMKEYPNGGRWTGSFDGGIQCFGFAKMVTYKLFGKYNGSYRGWSYSSAGNGMQLIGSTTDYSANSIKKLLSSAQPGDVLQFNTPKQHTMIVYSNPSYNHISKRRHWLRNKLSSYAVSVY